MDDLTLILGGAIFLFALYKLGTWNHNHFTSRGIKSLPTIPIFGSVASIVLRTKNTASLTAEACAKFKDERIVGVMAFLKPVLMVKDPELIKRITVKDFDHFVDHIELGPEHSDMIFSKNLFSLKGDKWRSMRNTLSPAFTSNKLKNMFGFIDKCGQQLADYLQEQQQPGKPYALEIKDLYSRFTNDVIATTAFGFHTDSLKEKDNEFYRTGSSLTDFTFKRMLFILGLSTKLAEILGLKYMTDKERNFLTGFVHDSIRTREKHGIVRPDMIHLLMQARKGELKGEEEIDSKVKKAELTDDDIAAQALVFFVAGFDTASTLLSFASFLLTKNEDAQRKLQQEIDQVLADGTGLTYEKLQNMKYIDMVISETLRMVPPAIILSRKCTKTYTIPSDGKQPAYTIKKGDGIWIPAYAIHHDPEYYPDPEKFDPERFSDENKQNIKPYTYMPFGVGPRLCIGQRLALLEAKVALFHLLSRFNLVPVDKTPATLELETRSLPVTLKGGFWMGVTPRPKIKS